MKSILVILQVQNLPFYRCKEISIHTFQKPSSNVSAPKFEIFVKNFLIAYIWVDLSILGSKESISMDKVYKSIEIYYLIKF